MVITAQLWVERLYRGSLSFLCLQASMDKELPVLGRAIWTYEFYILQEYGTDRRFGFG